MAEQEESAMASGGASGRNDQGKRTSGMKMWSRRSKDGQVLVRNLAFSFESTQRGWMSMDTYIPAIPIGQTMKAGTVGQVVDSNARDSPKAISSRDSSDGKTSRSAAAKD